MNENCVFPDARSLPNKVEYHFEQRTFVESSAVFSLWRSLFGLSLEISRVLYFRSAKLTRQRVVPCFAYSSPKKVFPLLDFPDHKTYLFLIIFLTVLVSNNFIFFPTAYTLDVTRYLIPSRFILLISFVLTNCKILY